MAEPEEMEGVPLDIVASDPKWVILEDPHGIEFKVPRVWVTGKNLEDPNEDFTMSHLNLAAPPGELEKLWQDATYDFEMDVTGGKADRSKTQSILDEYNNTGTWSQRGGGPVGKDWTLEPEDPEAPTPVTETRWTPKGIKKPAGPRFTSQTIPKEAGTGLGSWDQEWDAATRRWVPAKQ